MLCAGMRVCSFRGWQGRARTPQSEWGERTRVRCQPGADHAVPLGRHDIRRGAIHVCHSSRIGSCSLRRNMPNGMLLHRSPRPEAALHLFRFVVAVMNPAGFGGSAVTNPNLLNSRFESRFVPTIWRTHTQDSLGRF